MNFRLKKNVFRPYLPVFFSFILLLLAGCGSGDGGGNGDAPAYAPDRTVRVDYVIDGDTVILADGEKVRFLGIDAPEIRKSHGGRMEGVDEPWGRDAANFVGTLIEGKEVGLIFDAERKGKYGRTLAYIIWDGKLLQELLLKEGYARYVDYGNPLRYGEVLRRAESEARSRRRGLWEEGEGSFRPPDYLYAGRGGKSVYDGDAPELGTVPADLRYRIRPATASRLEFSREPSP